MKAWIKNNLTTVILAVVFLGGLCLLLYPSLADYWNSFHQSQAISSYAETVAAIDNDEYERIWNDAVNYNKNLARRGFKLGLSPEEAKVYDKTLDVTGTGIMGYIEIPEIRCNLPIYHGTDESVLQIAIGHLPGTSLPVGGIGTHCVLSGHRGLPSAKLFTNIDQLVEGDLFVIRTMDETLTYEVDQIRIVLPDEVEDLKPDPNEDYCTLVTCTPYGVNSHRLLVRGHRTDNVLDQIRVTADAQVIDAMFVAPMVAAPILLGLLVGVMATTRKKKN